MFIDYIKRILCNLKVFENEKILFLFDYCPAHVDASSIFEVLDKNNIEYKLITKGTILIYLYCIHTFH